MPRHVTETLGKYVVIKAYVNANHTGKMKTRRSHSGIIIYVNNAPIICYSKKQNIVEDSCFGLEFVSLIIITDMVEALQ